MKKNINKQKVLISALVMTIGLSLSACDSQKNEPVKENEVTETDPVKSSTESTVQEESATEAIATQEESSETPNNAEDWKQAYIDFLQSGAILPDASNQGLQIQDADAATYGIVDVNLDGIPELFLFPGCADWRYDLYTYYNGAVKLVDCSSSATCLFLYNLEGTPYYLGLQGSSYGNEIDVCTIENGERKLLLSYSSDYPLYEMGFQDSYTENYYVENNPVDEAAFEENAKEIFTDEEYEALMNFGLGTDAPLETPVKDLSLIENYTKTFENNDIATSSQKETSSADESEIANWVVLDGVQGSTDWSKIEIITYKSGIKATTICYWDGTEETSYDEKTTAALANSAIRSSPPTTDSNTSIATDASAKNSD